MNTRPELDLLSTMLSVAGAKDAEALTDALAETHGSPTLVRHARDLLYRTLASSDNGEGV